MNMKKITRKISIYDFREYCWTEWSFIYLWWEIENLPNWNSDWKTCVARKWDTSIRDTEALIYKYITDLEWTTNKN